MSLQEATEMTLDNPRETFQQFLTSKGLRVTNQRIAIFDAAYDAEDHYTAEDLLDRSRKIDSSVSRATVYRSLPILVESGMIREVDVGLDNKYYLANRETRTFQAQVIDADNDKIYEVDAPFMEWYGKTVCERLGMEPVAMRLQVTARKINPSKD
ncbi:Fur family transcriptional regulator [Cerasicoccus maritimus]|uniref:Fur family transcriptional regulator n=1 Tax=Cerasicoccus maritimus TaxID=490089 RepID=UPI002852B6F8|nr:transcriptional repressor [Cerasicoccus maritimus]